MARKAIPTDKLWEDSRHFVEALNHEGPLACALVGAASVEKALITLLSNFFIEGSETVKNILKENGALGEFSRTADVAYCLGLISKPMLENLKLIGQIRNRFAHSHVPLDFDSQEIKELCSRLTREKIYSKEDWEKHMPLPRVRFSTVASGLFFWLMLIASKTKHQSKCEDDAWPEK